jgi:hypothetical protein
MRKTRQSFPWLAGLFFLSLAGLMVFNLYHTLSPTRGVFLKTTPAIYSGDEPHYLMVVHSILFDHDLDLRDDYRRARNGDVNAGAFVDGSTLDHQTIIIASRTGQHEYWQKVYDWRIQLPCTTPDCVGFLKKSILFPSSEHTVEISSHPLGFPAILAFFAAVTFTTAAQVESRTLLFLTAFAWLGVLVTYLVAREKHRRSFTPLATCVVLGVASPWLVYARSYFTETTIGLCLIAALWALKKRKPFLCGLAIGLAFSIKPPFILVGLFWCVERWFSKEFREAKILGGVLACFVALVCGFNYWIARVAIISGPAGLNPVDSIRDLAATWIGPKVGLFPFVPWTVFSFVAIAFIRRAADQNAQMLRWIVWAVLPLALLFSIQDGPGSCFGPRYWVPLLPFLAIAACQLFDSLPIPRYRGVIVAMMVGTIIVSATSAIPASMMYPYVWGTKFYQTEKIFGHIALTRNSTLRSLRERFHGNLQRPITEQLY